ncbi:MAG: hypothetical protein SPI49_03280 [Eubacteriales bacterium]|nr:hypothetical protein [Eubacteriales bacterium]
MRLYGYIVRAIRKLKLAYDIIWKGGEEVLAMLFASRVITGRTKFSEVPAKLQPKVRQILVDEGLEELCEEK